MPRKTVALALAALAVLGAGASVSATELVLVGDAGNPGKTVAFKDIRKPYPRGGVGIPYRIGVGEVTNAEYAAFLNARAAKADPDNLYDERMAIRRAGTEGAWTYAPAEGREGDGVAFVSRVNAARYCNFLTTGSEAAGPYVVKTMPRENGSEHPAIVGYRDLTFPDAARVYFLPDMHEFFKAGWYDGNGGYRELAAATRDEPSHYGLKRHASGLREWMENKYYAGSPFALGADDGAGDAAALNTAVVYQGSDYEGNDRTGFRVAATAPLQFGDRLNRRNNFFFADADPADAVATLRIRSDAADRSCRARLELRDFADRPVWDKTLDLKLPQGVTGVPVELPERDGYYELRVTPADALFNNQTLVIPLAVMREPMPDRGVDGRFGFTCHITRRERRYSFETFDFDLLRRLGVSQVRVDVRFDDRNGSLTVLRRIREAGLNPLAIVPFRMNFLDNAERFAKERPEAAARWAARGVAPELAEYAEQVHGLVSAYKDVARDWEMGNEPTYWKMLPEDYGQILKVGHQAVKRADPSANVMAGDLNAIHAPVFRMGAGDFFDSAATHIYGFYVPMFWGIAGKMREMNGWMKAASIADKPVWITEVGGCTYSAVHMIPVRTLDEVRRYQAVHQPKIMAGGLAFGAARVLPYNFRDVPVDSLEEEFGMLDRFGLPKPAAASFRATAKLLGDARFVGFAKGHSFDVGAVAGLAFKDAEGRDVMVYWRNDPYGYGRFDIPFPETIRPPVTVAIPAAGTVVDGYDLSGGHDALAVKDGRVEVAVGEYPVFVRSRAGGGLSPEFGTVATAHDIRPVARTGATVKILPDRPGRSCDMMAGVMLQPRAGTDAKVDVRVYNQRGEPLSGTLRLEPMHNWREWDWPVTPAVAALAVPANGMATARFSVPIPKATKLAQPYYFNAYFDAADGGQYKDTVAVQPHGEEFALKDWITYAKGYKLASVENNSQVEITWDKDRAGFVSFYRRVPELFAENEAGLARDVVVPAMAERAGVTAVSLLFQDAGKETFQLKRSVKWKDGEWNAARFQAADLLRGGVIIHKGGNGRVDFPVRLLGVNFDLRGGADDGRIRVKPLTTEKPLARWEENAWTVYGEGYALTPGADVSEIRITRAAKGRGYASLFWKKPAELVKDADHWPKTMTVRFGPEGAGVTAVSFLLMDKGGETFQLKRPVKVAPGEWQTLRFDLAPLKDGANEVIVYGGDKNRTMDYPLRWLGLNFDFEKTDAELSLKVNRPAFDGADKAAPVTKPVEGAGGGAADM